MHLAKYAMAAGLLLASSLVAAEGLTARVSWEWPTDSVVINPVTGAITGGPPNYTPADFQDAVITWFVGSTQTVAGSKTVVAPTKFLDAALHCGDYSFEVYVRLKTGAPSGTAPKPPLLYATKVSCTGPKAPAVAVQ